MRPIVHITTALAATAGLAQSATAEGAPKDLVPGEAPILFTQGHEAIRLLDGTVANPDDIYLWVPA